MKNTILYTFLLVLISVLIPSYGYAEIVDNQNLSTLLCQFFQSQNVPETMKAWGNVKKEVEKSDDFIQYSWFVETQKFEIEYGYAFSKKYKKNIDYRISIYAKEGVSFFENEMLAKSWLSKLGEIKEVTYSGSDSKKISAIDAKYHYSSGRITHDWEVFTYMDLKSKTFKSVSVEWGEPKYKYFGNRFCNNN